MEQRSSKESSLVETWHMTRFIETKQLERRIVVPEIKGGKSQHLYILILCGMV
jgi:hypothetical protein